MFEHWTIPSSPKAIASPRLTHTVRNPARHSRSIDIVRARGPWFCATPPAAQHGVRAARVLSRRRGSCFFARHRPRFSTAFARSRHCPGAVLQPRGCNKSPYNEFKPRSDHSGPGGAFGWPAPQRRRKRGPRPPPSPCASPPAWGGRRRAASVCCAPPRRA